MTVSSSLFIPDGDEARRWAEEELSKSIYAEATPTPFDRFAKAIVDFFTDLLSAQGGAAFGPGAIVLVVAIIVAALVVALLVWGAPRRARAVRRTSGVLLGADDDRPARQLRSDAEKAARAGDWSAATILRYRAVARDLIERDLIDPTPGATAQAIAREAAVAFPQESAALAGAAGLFDEVRYFELPGTPSGYRLIADVDERMRTSTPQVVTA